MLSPDAVERLDQVREVERVKADWQARAQGVQRRQADRLAEPR
jgi:hypothetical protein